VKKVGIDLIPFSALKWSCGPELTDTVLSLLAVITTLSTSLPFVHTILSFFAPRPHVLPFPHFFSVIRLIRGVRAVEERRRSLSRFRNESYRSDRSALPVIVRVHSPDVSDCSDSIIESGRLSCIGDLRSIPSDDF
jgi:hypothetical protein